MSARHPAPKLPAEQLTIAWQSASLLLDYPDEELPSRLELIEGLCHRLPAAVGESLRSTVRDLRSADLATIQQEYVETFDTRRRHNLFLTYFAHGDTRRRGVALLRFKQTYLRSGFVLDDTELPDHLCVVLEYAATVDQRLGWGLLLDHRPGLELLRLALAEAGSRWHGAVEAVTSTLPRLAGDELVAIQRLAAEGPPQEEVGLTPYATPAFDPSTQPPAAAQELPMPTFPGAHR
ncbi:nitrate reductase molybdenum cofactor assembly chaperone [Kribbella flavida DSM 17836]|uniref:Nitrate reductase molybdenum cofactor assembly chaperone n=1 Tax=Kribbella flavida (strain DSM 17836 / JCM 10339 / NBRC 14399) TaxID=479435 RepID=D2PSR1_KRIFD|nr:nitrate reductase molybdenum cofactor assembly chaperone [Kribbella flavida]ADB33199.1 nitrate reductase molybdenum cofactor assembly chaperone [Kribbella flavida DSM 17836]